MARRSSDRLASRLCLVAITLLPVSTLECLSIRLTVDVSSLVVIAIYRPGFVRPTPQFFDDLTTTLESVVLLGCPYVIGRDFNVHMGDTVDAVAVSLTSILASFGLTQRVRGLNTSLDLVVASEDLADVSVAVDPPGTISDHEVVIADLPTRSVKQPASSRTVRGWRSVDWIAFSETAADSSLGKMPSADATAEELFCEYDSVLAVPG